MHRSLKFHLLDQLTNCIVVAGKTYNNNIIMFYSAHVVVYFGFLKFQISVVFLVCFLLVSRLRAGELSEPLGFLVSSPYNLSYEEKAGNYMVQITTIIKGLKNYSNN